MNKPDRDIVFFSGAGFSWNAGLPTMAKFGNESNLDYDTLKKHAESKRDSSNFRNAAPLLVSAADSFKGFQKLLQNNNTLTCNEADNMETVFCIAEMLHESGIEIIEINNNPKGSDTLLQEIQFWLWKIYQQYPPYNPARQTKIEVLNKLFELIKDLKLHNKMYVLSTNYDLVWENLFYQNGIPCSYPLSWRTVFRAGHGSEQYIFQSTQTERSAVLCKLHGSVNYFEDQLKSNGELFIASDLGDGTSIGKSGRWPMNYPAIHAVDAIWNIRNKYGASFVPSIIPPTYAKLRRYSWLREIWKTAFEAVKNANKIIFIGYSFPESDGFMRAFFQGALAMRKSNVSPEIYLIDPKDEVHERYQAFFKTKFKPIERLSLEDAINNSFIYNLFKK